VLVDAPKISRYIVLHRLSPLNISVCGARISLCNVNSPARPVDTEVIVYAQNVEAANCAKNLVKQIAEIILSRNIANEQSVAGSISKKESANDGNDASGSGDAGKKRRNSKSLRGDVNLLFIIPTNAVFGLIGPRGTVIQRLENGK
jgi:hypothetical protein